MHSGSTIDDWEDLPMATWGTRERAREWRRDGGREREKWMNQLCLLTHKTSLNFPLSDFLRRGFRARCLSVECFILHLHVLWMILPRCHLWPQMRFTVVFFYTLLTKTAEISWSWEWKRSPSSVSTVKMSLLSILKWFWDEQSPTEQSSCCPSRVAPLSSSLPRTRLACSWGVLIRCLFICTYPVKNTKKIFLNMTGKHTMANTLTIKRVGTS